MHSRSTAFTEPERAARQEIAPTPARRDGRVNAARQIANENAFEAPILGQDSRSLPHEVRTGARGTTDEVSLAKSLAGGSRVADYIHRLVNMDTSLLYELSTDRVEPAR